MVNETVINTLSQLVKKDPSSDLSPLLTHAAETYEVKRKILHDVMTDNLKPSVTNSESNDIRIKFKPSTPVTITHSLHPAVSQLLNMPPEPPSLSEIGAVLSEKEVIQLNHLITQGTVLWELGRLEVLRVCPDVIVKVGADLNVDHVSTVEMIKRLAPQIPIPNVLGILSSDTVVYEFQTSVAGQSLDKLWPDLTMAQKRHLQNHMDKIFANLRSIARPSAEQSLRPLGGGSPCRCKDVRREVRVADKPILSEGGFNDFLLSSSEYVRPEDIRRRMIHSYLRTDHEIVLTHGDLHPRNIMVVEEDNSESQPAVDGERPNFRISGVLDWELSGWYPSYWEYVKALHTISDDDGIADWWEFLPMEAIGSWGSEHAIDLMISRWLG